MNMIAAKYRIVIIPPAKVSDSPPVMSRKSDLTINLVTRLAQDSRWIKMNMMKKKTPVSIIASPM